MPITLQLPHQLAEQYRAKAKELDKTLGDVLLLSIGKAGERLPELVAEMSTPAETIGAFVLSTPRLSKEVLTAVQVHTRNSNVQALDKLVVDVSAGSRSELARAALAYALPDL